MIFTHHVNISHVQLIATTTRSLVVTWISRVLQPLTALGKPTDTVAH